MSHVRQQIRERVVEILTGLTTTGIHVSKSRVLPYSLDELPALTVRIENEQPLDTAITDDDGMTVDMDLIIEARAKGDDPDDTLDTIQAEVQSRMAQEPKLNGLVSATYWEGVDDNELETEGQVQIGRREIRYRIVTTYALRNPEVVVK